MGRFALWVIVLLFDTLSMVAEGTEQPISIDGKFSDWDLVAGGSNLKAASDARRVYIYFKLPDTVVLQNDSGIRIGFDSDNDPGTGGPILDQKTQEPVDGTGGFELVWNFGTRRGIRYNGGVSTDTEFRYSFLNLLTSPVIDSQEYEIAVSREHFTGERIRLMVVGASNQIIGECELVLDDEWFPVERSGQRAASADFRLCSYNVLFDSPWKEKQPVFEADLRAITPDIIAFQEIYDHNEEQTLDWVRSLDAGFQYSVQNADCHVVSKYPIVRRWELDKNLAAQLRLPDDREIIIISVHLPSGRSYKGRASELGTVQELIGDIRQGKFEPEVPADIPFILAGDCNFVSRDSTAIEAFMRETNSEIVEMLHLDENADYTWEERAADEFSPGKLDWVFASPGIVFLNSFIFRGGQASDHMPLVMDVAFD